MEKCAVCGMNLKPGEAAGTTDYQGRTYYFCSEECKEEFDSNPQRYATQTAGARKK